MNDSHIIVSVGAVGSEDYYAIVQSAASFTRLVLEEGGTTDDLHPVQALSFCLDRYDGEVKNGGFSQYVYNTHLSETYFVAEALRRMSSDDDTDGLKDPEDRRVAGEHVEYFARMLAKAEENPEKLETFYAGQYFGDDPFRDSLNDDAYYRLGDLTELNSRWLRNHEDLQSHTLDEMYALAEAIVGHPIEK
jgi:hypothetical protein